MLSILAQFAVDVGPTAAAATTLAATLGGGGIGVAVVTWLMRRDDRRESKQEEIQTASNAAREAERVAFLAALDRQTERCSVELGKITDAFVRDRELDRENRREISQRISTAVADLARVTPPSIRQPAESEGA